MLVLLPVLSELRCEDEVKDVAAGSIATAAAVERSKLGVFTAKT